MEYLIERIKSLYNELSANHCSHDLLAQVYQDNVLFIDPFHTINGLSALTGYMGSMYQGVKHCRFSFSDQIIQPEHATLVWQMSFAHPKLNAGQAIVVDGITHLKGTEKVAYHRDYFDGGQLLYEHIPVMGRIVKMLKNRLAQEA
jgi:hypothetical protein